VSHLDPTVSAPDRGATRRGSRRIRKRGLEAFSSSNPSHTLKRSRRRRRKILIFRLLLAALFVTLLAALFLISRNPIDPMDRDLRNPPLLFQPETR
jgi:hypothetical protein